jgi:type IV pilus assembly protein PilW
MRPFSQTAERGFSMIELMVAAVIGLIGMVIIFQVFEVSESIKRTTTSGGDAQQNGAIALYVMEHDLRNGGMGFNETTYAGCPIVGSDSTQSPAAFATTANPILMAPVRIVSGGNATTPDTLSVFYGSQQQIADSTTLVANQSAATDEFAVVNPFGFRPGDLIMVIQPGATCKGAFAEVSGVPATPSNQINHDSTSYALLGGGTTVTSRFNPFPAGVAAFNGVGGANVARIYNLGNLYDANGSSLPVYNTYAVATNTLTVASKFSSTPAVAVADNIVQMRAVYGLDDGTNNGTVTYTGGTFAANDGIIDRFVDGTTTPNWSQVIAVRVAVVARSAQPEKPSSGVVSDPCDTTTTEPTWSGTAWATSAPNLNTHLDVSSDANWKCYRYRVFETTIPLRNWIWKSS